GTQARPSPCGGTSVRDTTNQNQDAGYTPGAQHPPAGPPQRTAITLNAPDVAFVACKRSFRQGARSSPPPVRDNTSAGISVAIFAFVTGIPPHHRRRMVIALSHLRAAPRPNQQPAEDSLRLDVRRLDDRPPLLDLGLLLRGKRLRRLFVARPDSLTQVGKPLAHRGIGQGLHQR